MADRRERDSTDLACAVIDVVRSNHPAVRIDVVKERPEQHFTIVTFTPPNKSGARVRLYANYDWSFTLECGRFQLFDDEPMLDDDEAARVALIAQEIESLATRGLERSMLDRLIGFGDRIDPWVK